MECIEDAAFQGCVKIEKLLFPNSLKYIGALAFCPYERTGGMNIETIEFGARLETIGQYAFSRCYKIERLKLNNITSIEKGAFNSCVKLEQVVIGKNIETIEEYAFDGCRGVDIYCYAQTPPCCKDLDGVGTYYVLEENYRNWVNSGKVHPNKVDVFEAKAVN